MTATKTKRGRPATFPNAKTVKLQTTIRSSTYQALKRHVKAYGGTISGFVDDAVRRALEL